MEKLDILVRTVLRWCAFASEEEPAGYELLFRNICWFKFERSFFTDLSNLVSDVCCMFILNRSVVTA